MKKRKNKITFDSILSLFDWDKKEGYIKKNLWQSPSSVFIFLLAIINFMGIIYIYDTCFFNVKAGSAAVGIKHLFFLAASIILCILYSTMDLRNAKKFTILGLGISLFTLIWMALFGHETNGATRWIGFSFLRIQPTEFAKVAFVYSLALLLDLTRNFKYPAWKQNYRNFKWFWTIIALLGISFLLIAASSASAAITFFLLILFVTYIGGINKKITYISIAAALLIFSLFFIKGLNIYFSDNPTTKKVVETCVEEANKLSVALNKNENERTVEEKDLVKNYNIQNNLIKLTKEEKEKEKENDEKNSKVYQALHFFELKDFRSRRVAAWFKPEKYYTSEGKQSYTSIYGISSGGIFGKGLTRGKIKEKLPECDNDYIFATIIEETGLLGGTIFIVIFILFFYHGFKICENCKNTYGKNLGFGALFILMCQFFMNIAVALNMMPTTGVCLPFISSGGSSLLTSFWLVGIIISVSRQANLENDLISPSDVIKINGKDIKIPREYNPRQKVRMYSKTKSDN